MKNQRGLRAVVDRVGRHTSMLVQPVGLSIMMMPSGIGCASFAPSIRRVCAVQAFRRKAEPCRRRNSFPPRMKNQRGLRAVVDRVGRHTSMLVQPVGLSIMMMPSGIGCASFAPSIRRVCAVQAFRRKAEPCRRRNSFPPRMKNQRGLRAVVDRVGRHTSMLVQPVGLSMIRMPSGIGCASFAPSIRRVCAVQAFRRKAELLFTPPPQPARRRGLPPSRRQGSRGTRSPRPRGARRRRARRRPSSR